MCQDQTFNNNPILYIWDKIGTLTTIAYCSYGTRLQVKQYSHPNMTLQAKPTQTSDKNTQVTNSSDVEYVK